MSNSVIFFVALLLSSIAGVGQEPKMVLPVGHADEIRTARFSYDGKRIVTASYDGTIKIWDATKGKLLVDLKKYSFRVESAAFSPDGKKVIAASRQFSVKVWEIETGHLSMEINHPYGGVNSALFSSDGKKIVVASTDSIVRTFDAETGTKLAEFKGHSDEIFSAEFSKDNKKIVTASFDQTVKIWDAETGILTSDVPFANDVKSAKFSKDGNKVLIVLQDGAISLLNLDSKERVTILEGIIFSDADFSPDGRMVIASAGTLVHIWNIEQAIEVEIVQDLINNNPGRHYSKINSIQFSPNGKKFITCSVDRIAKIWDLETGDMLVDFKGFTDEATSFDFIEKSNKIITATRQDIRLGVLPLYLESINILDTKTGMRSSSPKVYDNVNSYALSPNGERIIISGEMDATIWDVNTGFQIMSLRHKTNVYSYGEVDFAQYTRDAGRIITLGLDTVKIWNAETGEFISDISNNYYDPLLKISPDGTRVAIVAHYNNDNLDTKFTLWNTDSVNMMEISGNHKKGINLAAFSPDNKKIVTISDDGVSKIWNTGNGNLLSVLEGYEGKYSFLRFSQDGRKLAAVTHDNDTIKVWDVLKGKTITSLIGHMLKINSIYFSSDGEKIITASEDKTAKIWDARTGKILANLNGHSQSVNFAQFSNNNKRVTSASADNTFKTWDVLTGELIYTFFSVDTLGYFIRTRSGYYLTTTNIAKLLHYVTADLNVITFEQLDVKYNRPDKVLEAIGNTDTALIKSYRKAWEKRIKKLGVDTTAFREGYSVPDADFANRDNIEFEQKNGMLKLHIKGMDSAYKLDRFNVWVNEAPVFGQRGVSIKKRNKNELDTSITIKLSQGENRIESSITNVNATESYRMPLNVNYTPAVKQREMTRFIGIGIDQFADSKYNLQYSVKDIRDLADSFKRKYKDNIIIDTLFNANVTVSNVKALKQKLQQTNENDKVIIAYSGHGMLSKEYDYYLSTYAVNFDKPEENGLPYDELENLLDSIPARKKLMLIDACHSGEVDKEDLVTLNASTDSLIKGLKPVAYKNEGHLGLKSSFELMQSLFVNVGKSTGATVISAAAGTQFALERNDLKNGVFTYSILEAMKDHPEMKISELKRIVGKRVEELTKGLQKPTSRNETIAVDWRVW